MAHAVDVPGLNALLPVVRPLGKGCTSEHRLCDTGDLASQAWKVTALKRTCGKTGSAPAAGPLLHGPDRPLARASRRPTPCLAVLQGTAPPTWPAGLPCPGTTSPPGRMRTLLTASVSAPPPQQPQPMRSRQIPEPARLRPTWAGCGGRQQGAQGLAAKAPSTCCHLPVLVLRLP